MTDTADGTAVLDEPAPESESSEAPKTDDDKVTKLLSRIAGLDAKVGTLSTTAADAIARAEAAEARALALAEGKENGDAELRAQNERLKAEAAEARQTAKVSALARQYPESFAELGEAIGDISPEKLSAIEARLAGVAAADEEEQTNPRPIGNNQSRVENRSAKRTPQQELADMEARFLSTPFDTDF